MDGKTIARFWSHVDKRGPDECWEWKLCRNTARGGYGYVRAEKQNFRAHRLAWLISFGEIAPGLFVCHRCDNPGCCNPAHLFLGTNADNVHDMDSKGRRRWSDSSGAKNGRAKLTEDGVRKARALAEAGVFQREIARQLGISHGMVGHILRGRNWTHIR